MIFVGLIDGSILVVNLMNKYQVINCTDIGTPILGMHHYVSQNSHEDFLIVTSCTDLVFLISTSTDDSFGKVLKTTSVNGKITASDIKSNIIALAVNTKHVPKNSERARADDYDKEYDQETHGYYDHNWIVDEVGKFFSNDYTP